MSSAADKRKQQRKQAKLAAAETQQSVTKKDLGVRAFAEKDYESAISYFTAAIEEDAAQPALFNNRSAAYSAKGEFILALKDAQSAIELKPDWAKAHFRKGIALEGLKVYAKAKEAYEHAKKLDASDAAVVKSLEDLDKLLAADSSLISSTSSVPLPGEDDAFDRMISWLKAGGAQFPYLYMRYYAEDYRGVHCLAKIPNNKVILYVPLGLIMTSEVAKASEIGQKIINSGVDLGSTHSYLAAFLCQEKHNPNTIWKPYLATLPQKYRNMPIFFDDSELTYLTGSFSLGKIADRKIELKEEYENICAAVPEFSRFTLDEFIWARLVVITRIFGLMINGNKTDGLVPFADMLNHRRPRQTSWQYTDDRKGFIITSLEEIERGDQVFDSYGRKCNSRFFVNYGFSLDNNEDNQVALFFTLPPADPQYSMKVRILGGAKNVERRRFQVPMDYREEFAKEAMSFLRVIHAKDSEFLLLQANEQFDAKNVDPISLRNELSIISALCEASKEILSGFPTSLEDDNRLLAADAALPSNAPEKLTFNIRNCIVMRRGEKEVLHYYIALPGEVSKFLQTPRKDMKKVVNKSYSNVNNPLHLYISQIIMPLALREQ